MDVVQVLIADARLSLPSACDAQFAERSYGRGQGLAVLQ